MERQRPGPTGPPSGSCWLPCQHLVLRLWPPPERQVPGSCSQAAHPRSLRFGAADREPPTYNDEPAAGVWGKGTGEKMAATASNPISFLSGKEVESSKHSPCTSARTSERGPACLSPPGVAGLPGSLSLLHYGRRLRPHLQPHQGVGSPLRGRLPFVSSTRPELTQRDPRRVPVPT